MLIIEADMVVQGELTIVGTVLVEGRFEGNLVCSRLEIGVDGYVLGRAIAGEIDVSGQFVGEVIAREVYLRSTALIEGEVKHEQLRMDESAALVGESKRHARLEMPPAFLALETRARMAESDFRNLETSSRVRHAQEALNAKAQFDSLRARFPAPRAPNTRAPF
jgi:cytoskeletal protein CcmA (bactofilin family)